MTKIIGIDPALRSTGWAVINAGNSSLQYIASGIIKSLPSIKKKNSAGEIIEIKIPLAERLLEINQQLVPILKKYQPEQAAIEQTFVNMNAKSSLKLSQARGALILTLAQFGLSVAEYSPNLVKKSVVGAGKAGKEQVTAMIKILLPQCKEPSEDEADALAIAITHCHHF